MIIDKLLPKGEYYEDIVKKDTIYIHHTAGSHRPDYTIDGWANDKNAKGGKLLVGTAYVMGGISTRDRNADFDGVILRAFDDKYWAHHLGTKQANNLVLNQKSIGIEICNYGPCHKTPDGKYLNYVNSEVPVDMVYKLTTPWKGFTHYHKYTTKQISSLKDLLIKIATAHGIDLKKGIQFANSFDVNLAATTGQPGLWVHTSVRSDKFDLSPMPEMINMIKSL